MKRVITYGTFDLLHYGHIRLLERAKTLGDYLIVGVTADDFDKTRGKINVCQSLMERVEAIRAAGIADKIIIEEYEGQKIDDICKYNVDIFTVGDDWRGKFDYLNEYCKVVYLERTRGISSSEIREEKRSLNIGLIGESLFLNKVMREAVYVNGINVNVLCTKRPELMDKELISNTIITDNYDDLLRRVDAVYIRSLPENHYEHIKKALDLGKHILCESPITLDKDKTKELFELAEEKKLILMEAIKTAYSTAFTRLLLLVKTGKIGDVISVDSICTSLKKEEDWKQGEWNGIYEWGPTALLPIFKLLGTEYKEYKTVTHFRDDNNCDSFTKMDFVYKHAVASIKIGDGIKSEGELIISGKNGYIYVPAPWWNTDYFEVRYENPADSKRYFYQLDGEGIRYELAAFARAIERGRAITNIDKTVTYKISDIMEDYTNGRNMIKI